MVARSSILLHFASTLLRPRARKSFGRYFVEIRFVLSPAMTHYVQVFGRCTSWLWSARLFATAYRIALVDMYPEVNCRGQFESRITVRRDTSAVLPFWNPHLVIMALSEKGRLILRSASVQEVIPTIQDGDDDVDTLRRRRCLAIAERQN